MTEKTLHTESLFSGRIVHLRRDWIELETGVIATREIIDHAPAVVVIAMPSKTEIIVVEQFRTPLGRQLFEVPAGLINPGEEPMSAAKRELAEETGFTALDWQPLFSGFPTPGFCNEELFFFLAKGLVSGAQHLDEDELVQVHAWTLDQMGQKLASGELIDIKTILAYFVAKDRLNAPC
ncbi:MAG: NUDIX hydrolase [Candidatus Margulisiibacteriota bacterium]